MKKIRILILEDAQHDVELMKLELIKGGIAFESIVVDTEKDYRNALQDFKPDAILSDHSMPQFTSTVALEIYRQQQIDVPFILVTGSVSEEFAVSSILSGACDYILKSNITRLPLALTNAIQSFKLKKDYKSHEKKLLQKTTFLDNIISAQPVIFYVVDILNNMEINYISANTMDITGYTEHEFLSNSKLWFDNLHEEDREDVNQKLEHVVLESEGSLEYRWKCADGTYKWFLDNLKIVTDENGGKWGHGCFIDVSKLKNADYRNLLYTKGVDDMLYMISHQIRHSITQLLGLYNVIDSEDIDEGEMKKFISYMKEPANSLDLYTRDLTHLLDELKIKNKNVL